MTACIVWSMAAVFAAALPWMVWGFGSILLECPQCGALVYRGEACACGYGAPVRPTCELGLTGI